MSNISDKIKANEKIDRYVKEHLTKICDTCKREKETSLFVRSPRSVGYSKKHMDSTCPECNNYKDLTTNKSFYNLQHIMDDWYENTRRLSNHCEFIIKYEKENNIKTREGIINLKELLTTICEKLKGKKQ